MGVKIDDGPISSLDFSFTGDVPLNIYFNPKKIIDATFVQEL